MNKLYGYSSLTDKDYYRSVMECSKYCSGEDPNIFFDIMSNKTVLCFDNKFGTLNYEPYDLLHRFIDDINSTDFTDLINRIDVKTLHYSEIPMFNSISSINPLIRHMSNSISLTYASAGEILCNSYDNKTTKSKAGELHLKLLSMMGLGELELISPRRCNTTLLGNYYISLNAQSRKKLLQKMIIKIPIIPILLQNATNGPVSIKKIIEDTHISGTTVGRRSSSVKALLNYLEHDSDTKLHKLYSNIYI